MSNSIAPATQALWPLVVYFAAIVLIVSLMMLVSYVLGQRHRERSTGKPYESGVAPTASARLRFDVKFYMMAMFFVIFDLEAIFIFSWAIAIRELGWSGYIEILVFIGVLAILLIYLWRLGALQWGPSHPKGRISDRG